MKTLTLTVKKVTAEESYTTIKLEPTIDFADGSTEVSGALFLKTPPEGQLFTLGDQIVITVQDDPIEEPIA